MSGEKTTPVVLDQPAFNNELYLEAQLAAFQGRMKSMPDANLIVEFGGKPFGDHHAARVFPGYNPDNKAAIVRGLQQECNSKIAMVVNARDILYPPEGRTLHGRIRGDSGLRYDDETVRIVNEAKQVHGIDVESVVVAVTPRQMEQANVTAIENFAATLYRSTGITLSFCYEVPGYPDTNCLDGEKFDTIFGGDDTIADPNRSLVLLSPGGGSGKFGVALSEIYKKLAASEPVGFAKFETFPIFSLSPDHPINLAFIAATADLGNRLVDLGSGRTNYDKDCENFALLAEMVGYLPDAAGYIKAMESQFDFSVNVIEVGITDEELVKRAALKEIGRRLIRYRQECLAGDEKLSTLELAANMAGQCAMHYFRQNLMSEEARLA